MRRRFDALTESTAVDRERARGWGIVHALAWGMDDSAHRATAEFLSRIRP